VSACYFLVWERKKIITISVSKWQYVISLLENDKYIVARKQFPKTKFSKDNIYVDKEMSQVQSQSNAET